MTPPIAMIYQLQFRIQIDLPTKDQATRHLIKWFRQLEMVDRRVEEYWKFPGTFMGSFTSSFCEESHAELIYAVLQLAQSLVTGDWYVNGPTKRETR